MNQHCDIQTTKLSRRKDFKNKQNNKNKANKKRDKSLQEKEKRERESKSRPSNPNNQSGKLNCQSGIFTPANILTYLPIVAGIDTNKIVSEIENVTALYIALRDSQSSVHAASILFLFVKNYCSGSILTQVIDFIKTECSFDILNPQSSEIPEPTWLSALKSLKTNWQSVVHNSAFKQISNLMSMSAALGLCDLSNMNFDVNGIRIFSIPTYKKHVNAPDFVSAIFDTFVYFVEGGYKCFTEGNLTPFIYSGDEAMQFEEEYFSMLDLAPFMKAGNLETKKGVTENDFDFRLNALIDKADTLYRAAEGTWEKRVLFDRVTQLRRIRSDFIALRVDGKLRKSPYSIYIDGPSGVGKSSVSALLMRIVLLANGFQAGDERLTTLNEADKYMSTYRSHINGIFVDDLGNTKSEFIEKSPVERVIEIVNNVPSYANVAEADLKGKVSIEPQCLIGTSNLALSVLADQYSNEPYSIVRRFPTQLHVTVKEEYALPDGRLDSHIIREKFPDGVPTISDLWNFELYVPHDDKRNQFRRTLGTMDIYQVIEYVKEDSKTHFANQVDVVNFATDLDQKLEKISWTKPLNNQAFFEPPVKVTQLIDQISQFDSKWLCWMNYVPEYMFNNKYVDYLLTLTHSKEIFDNTSEAYKAWKGALFFSLCIFFLNTFIAVLFCSCITYLYGRSLYRKQNEILDRLHYTRGLMPIVFKRVRDNHIVHIAGVGTLLGIVYLMVRAYRAARTLNLQGNLSPATFKDIEERDAEINPWSSVHVTRPYVAKGSDGIQPDALKKRVFENLFYMEITDSETRRYCDAFFVKSNIALIPDHMFKKDEMIAKFYRRGGETNGAYFSAIVSKTFSYHLPNTDMRAVWIANAPSTKDLTKYLAVSNYGVTPATMIWKSKEGECKTFDALLQPGTVRTHACNFQGFNYKLEVETFNGLCMGVWLSNSVARQIIGVHLGGKGHRGGAGSLTHAMIVDAERNLRKIEGLLLHKSEGEMMLNQYGVQYFIGSDIHPKSPVNFLPLGANVEVYGSVSGGTSAHSAVEKTCISSHVTEICGVPQKWGPPKFGPQKWKPWQESLSHSCKPSIGIEGSLLKRAVVDYKVPLIKILRSCAHVRDDIAPLTDMQTLCGIDGKRFIDKMKSSTSVGYPLSGPKSAYLTVLNPDDHPGCAFPVELDAQFWDEYRRMEKLYLQGKRAYPIFKASLKDEPTKLTKDKVRVFQAAPIALQLGVRKYFLPVARFLSLHPFVSECAVGINAQGPEWDQMSRHMMKFGDDRILAGDYSKYDLRMPSQIVFAAFRILIDLAKETGNYTDDHINIMEGIAADIANPLMAYNGDLLMLFGSNPSGQNLTVYVNSIANSLLFRCAFYDIKVNWKNITFQEICAILTYGDDVKGSVKQGHDDFNHISVANFLAARDMKFTMPDKESAPVPYMRDMDADFLKRKNIYNEELNLYFGALDEESIFKSLHSVLHSKAVTNEEQCMQNIDGALREWFAHGREIYEMRRLQMDSVATMANIRYGCTQLDVSYDEAMQRFREKYLNAST